MKIKKNQKNSHRCFLYGSDTTLPAIRGFTASSSKASLYRTFFLYDRENFLFFRKKQFRFFTGAEVFK